MKSKLLLHVCCAPDATVALERLIEDYELGVFWYNANIYPNDEYLKRLKAFKKVLRYYKISLHLRPYDYDIFLNKVIEIENDKFEPEGGKRCAQCFAFQFEALAQEAVAQNYQIIASTLSASPHKNLNLINGIGKQIAEKFNLLFLETAFRKNNGFLRSLELCRQWDIYRQNYCGCEFSLKRTL